MLQEIDDELRNVNADLVITPVGVGSFAHAVVSHYKSKDVPSAVLAVEPDTAASLWKSLTRGKVQPEETTYTTLAGLNCGTVSSISWPFLQSECKWSSLTFSPCAWPSNITIISIIRTTEAPGPLNLYHIPSCISLSFMAFTTTTWQDPWT